MSQTNALALFNGFDASGHAALFVTDGTSGGSYEITVNGVAAFGFNPGNFAPIPVRLAVMLGYDAARNNGLWVSDGTTAGTHEIVVANAHNGSLIPADLTNFGSVVLFNGRDSNNHNGLYVTDGTSAGTTELAVANAGTAGLNPRNMFVDVNTAGHSSIVFAGMDAAGVTGLWRTDATAAGTTEVTVAGAAATGLAPSGFDYFGNALLFAGHDATGANNLWSINATTLTGAQEITATGQNPFGLAPANIVTLGTIALFSGSDAAGNTGLWVTDGTAAGTTELAVANVYAPLFGAGFNPQSLRVLNGHVYFAATDAADVNGLWVSDGTAAGTHEITVNGAATTGLAPSGITVLGNKLVMSGKDAAGNYGLWTSDGTTAGTFELSVTGGASNGTSPYQITYIPGLRIDTACFCSGTRIRTARGEVAVEALTVGDVTIAPDGARHPVRWIGSWEVDCARHDQPLDVHPVRVRRHAFGPGQPGRDLYLSPDHAVWVEAALIPVRHLVNGTTIAQVRRRRVTYWHVQLDRHALLSAEGLACESYLDTGDQRAGAAHWTREANGFAPLTVCGPAVETARRRLLSSAGHATAPARGRATSPARRHV